MIRTVVKPKNKKVSIELPQHYVGKNVEIIAFTLDDVSDTELEENVPIHLASERVLAKEWLSKEEDAAWANL
jgi:hypothetical protein